MISGMVREGREREGWQWGGGQSLLLMMQLWGESDDERFSNQPKSKHSGGSQWSREVCKHFVRTKAKYHPRRYNLLPVFFTRYATMGGVSQWLAISSTLLYSISLTWMVKNPIKMSRYYLVEQQTKQLPILDKIFVGSRHCWVVKYLVFVACMLCCFLCSPENSASRPSRSWLCAPSSYHRNCVEAIKRGTFMLYVIQWTPFSANMKGWRCLQVRSVPGEEARISGSCFDHRALTTHLDVARQLLVVSGEL